MDQICLTHWTLLSAVELGAAGDLGAGERSALLLVLSPPPHAHSSSLAPWLPVLSTGVCMGHIGKFLAQGAPSLTRKQRGPNFCLVKVIQS